MTDGFFRAEVGEQPKGASQLSRHADVVDFGVIDPVGGQHGRRYVGILAFEPAAAALAGEFSRCVAAIGHDTDHRRGRTKAGPDLGEREPANKAELFEVLPREKHCGQMARRKIGVHRYQVKLWSI